ncbi:MAG: multidrug ABC transporter ATPase [Lysinibacillus sp.]
MHNEPLVNGYMANTMKEIIMLGKEMEHIKEKHKEDSRKPDPEQFDEVE